MNKPHHISFFTLLLMISFASVNAVLFTPALPAIAADFAVPIGIAQQTMTVFLIAYALGQLIYGPLASRFGRKQALYAGIGLQILSSLLCILAGVVHLFPLLLIGRFLVALGAGVGLQMAFTLVNECYEPKVANEKIAYLMLAFAITPGLSVTLGSVLTEHFGWESCFVAGMVYGVIMLVLTARLPESRQALRLDALRFSKLLQNYGRQFRNPRLVASGLLMGSGTSFVYLFAALAPFVAMDLMGMNSIDYGMANLIPSAGLVIGCLCAAQFAKHRSHHYNMALGISIALIAALTMLIAVWHQEGPLVSLFFPMLVANIGLGFIFPNASTLGMQSNDDKAHGSATMSFINMTTATIVVLSLGMLKLNLFLLPITFLALSFFMIAVKWWAMREKIKITF